MKGALKTIRAARQPGVGRVRNYSRDARHAVGGSCRRSVSEVGGRVKDVRVMAMRGTLEYDRPMMNASSREDRRERMQVRVTPSAKALIQRAMAVSGLSAGELAYEEARRVLEAHERMDVR